MHHGYEPSRVAALSQHCSWSIAELDAIRSADPAAADALAAVTRMRSILADSIMAATRDVGRVNPLGRSMGWSPAMPLPARQPSALDQWMNQQFPSASQPAATDEHTIHGDTIDEAARSDQDVIGELRRFGDEAPTDAWFDPEHPHWDGFGALAADLAERTIDPGTGEITDFGQLLIDNVWQLPALPLVAVHKGVHPKFGAALVTAIMHPDLPNSPNVHRMEAFSVEAMLMQLSDHPLVLADMLMHDHQRILNGDLDIERSLIFQLMDSDVIDPRVIADALSVVLDTSGPVHVTDIQITLALLTQTANTASFERGFPGPIAMTLATAFVAVLPDLEHRIRVNQTIVFDEIGDSDDAVRLGSYADVRDFLGAILIDPAGLVLLYALGAQAEAMGRGEIAPGDVNAYGRLLHASFEENLHEIEIAASRDRAEWAAALAVVSFGVGVGPVGRALGPVGVKLAQAAVKRLESAGAGSSTPHRDNDDIGLVADVMIRFGSYEGFLERHDMRNGVGVGGGDGGGSNAARSKLAAAWAQFEAGEPLHEVSRTLGNVGELISELDSADFFRDQQTALDHVLPMAESADLD